MNKQLDLVMLMTERASEAAALAQRARASAGEAAALKRRTAIAHNWNSTYQRTLLLSIANERKAVLLFAYAMQSDAIGEASTGELSAIWSLSYTSAQLLAVAATASIAAARAARDRLLSDPIGIGNSDRIFTRNIAAGESYIAAAKLALQTANSATLTLTYQTGESGEPERERVLAYARELATIAAELSELTGAVSAEHLRYVAADACVQCGGELGESGMLCTACESELSALFNL